jgi:hypothetical protein
MTFAASAATSRRQNTAAADGGCWENAPSRLKPVVRRRRRTYGDSPITPERIDELLRFLPVLGSPGPGTEPQWHHLDQEPKDGVFVMPYPAYPPVVEEFFRLAGQDCWCDFQYAPEQAGEMVRDDAAIASASLAQIKTMLTFCVRGERFCDGHWGAMVREGRIGAILRRLSQLRSEAADSEPSAAGERGRN